jgi:2-polyprenyl-3-methyl-5-hydroxy-6-metoxy-1,4-benzoquinol methylase
MTSRQAHWNEVYATKAADKVSWFQARAEISMRLIAAAGANEESAIIDIGSGVSVLVDQLVDAGFGDVTALDISERALRLT